ncbi:PQQ-binding-like beta-propeller repeat protein [Limnoglobus roseus]|uniref:Serine/threonine protein kinase n=1 Tax=Limnoglobus roseus TaxID=2598579 RepID=A0A5C1AJJ7_9BACT|nr:PQQ-binding-like beta-propeller repeat protein [Limnoglobus roseus]QEL17314.1 serine/threonine protein kinase [Limnoglobus roseus]
MIRTILLGMLLTTAVRADDPWATYRGNPQRTGNTDGMAIPDSPKVLWAIKSNDHFIAAPVPVGENLYLSRLGAFNQPHLGLFPRTAAGEPKAVWSKAVPYLRLASVSSPAVSGNLIVFGDGMHQDAGGVLHGLAVNTGRPLWQLTMPGDLTHLEGAPTIAGGKVFMGGGAAGAFCVDPTSLTLDGKPVAAAVVPQLQEAKWKELQAQYEAEKKKDPALAVPPSEDQLLKPMPKVVWQKGAVKWHVDAPVCVAGDKVLVATSLLEKEKVGERALYCLNAASGEQLWTAPLKLNPWGGASVVGDTVVISGSTIGYYYAQLKGAKGDVSAFDLKTGAPKWRKEVPGGVVGCVALTDELAVCTASDGKVRAFALADGERRWLYDAKTPIFAPPAVAGGGVYVGDLSGAIHAIDLKTGNGKWTLDLGKDPATQSPGMVYGGPTIADGKLFIATCNLEGPLARKPTFVACVGK